MFVDDVRVLRDGEHTERCGADAQAVDAPRQRPVYGPARLTGTRAGATIAGGRRTEIAAGTLVVSGSGTDSYYVADAAGERDLTGFRRTGTPMELLPGTYVARLNGTRAGVTITGGQRTEIAPGSVVVTGAANSYLADSAGERDLTGFRRTGTPVELLPGTYVVRLGDRRLPVQVRPGVQAAVGP